MAIAKKLYKTLIVLSAVIWLANGLFCKVLNLVPRHQEIVARILGEQHSQLLTKLIGASEILMALWILSGIRSRLNVFVQVSVIATMNLIEFIYAHDLLLWGRLNAVFAFLFLCLISLNEFWLKNKLNY